MAEPAVLGPMLPVFTNEARKFTFLFGVSRRMVGELVTYGWARVGRVVFLVIRIVVFIPVRLNGAVVSAVIGVSARGRGYPCFSEGG